MCEYLPIKDRIILHKSPSIMNLAKKVAATAPYYRYKLGAVIAHKNSIISVGTNQTKTHPLQKMFSNRGEDRPWMHAEIHSLALSRVEDLLGSTMYVARVIKNGDLANSRPCGGCHNAMKHFGISEMVYYEDGCMYKESV